PKAAIPVGRRMLRVQARLLCCLLLPVLRQGKGLRGGGQGRGWGPPHGDFDWVALYCWAPFHATLMATPEGSRCRWEQIGRWVAYSELSACTELLARLFDCPWPSTALDAFFLQVHAEYFSNCSRTEPPGPGGPPPGLAAAVAVGLGCLVPLAAAVTLSRARRGARSPAGGGTAPGVPVPELG
uniref:Receptor activity modifying protein 1 n=1 Tax=Anas zonorhyncha TaxID=75864 RepID=A0A8B9UGL2_9AVES